MKYFFFRWKITIYERKAEKKKLWSTMKIVAKREWCRNFFFFFWIYVNMNLVTDAWKHGLYSGFFFCSTSWCCRCHYCCCCRRRRWNCLKILFQFNLLDKKQTIHMLTKFHDPEIDNVIFVVIQTVHIVQYIYKILCFQT